MQCNENSDISRRFGGLPPASPKMVSKSEFCELTTLSLSTLDRRIKDGIIPVTRVGRRVLINYDAAVGALASYSARIAELN